MLLVHYGCKRLSFKKILKIKNQLFCKPLGGFWTCPINSLYYWKDFCVNENFRNGYCDNKIIVKLKSKKILKIDNKSDLNKMIWLKNDFFMYPDFETMSKKYDAIYLTHKGQMETRLSFPNNLYGWDIECVLILNASKIKQIRLKYVKHHFLTIKKKAD